LVRLRDGGEGVKKLKRMKNRAADHWERADALCLVLMNLATVAIRIKHPDLTAAVGRLEELTYGAEGEGLYQYAVDNAMTHGLVEDRIPDGWEPLPTFKA
jgi:hypothetical protein